MINEIEILNVLNDIEESKLTLVCKVDPYEVYAGNVIYNISNGWQITIFNDSGYWDYIDNIKTDDGREINFDELDNIQSLRNYQPSEKTCLNIYKMKFENE